MAVIAAPVPLVMKDVILTLGTDGYQKHVSGVRFEPSASTVSWQGLTPDSSYTEATTATWTCVLAYAQDWTAVDSLSRFLLENEGDTVEATFKPKSGEGVSFTADVSIVPGTIGGDVNAVAVASVTLGCDKPVLVPAA